MLTLADLDTQFHLSTLPNGIRVAVFERPGMPVYLRACFLSGSRFDEKEGTAHLLEHVLVSGTKKFPSKDQLAAYIEQRGGIFGATTSHDALSINVGVGDPADLSKIFEVLHEILFASHFDEKVLEMERGSVLSELRDRRSNPRILVWDVAERAIFQGTPLAKPAGGTDRGVRAIEKKDLLEFFHTNITAERTVLVVSGGITSKEVIAEAERLLPLSSAPRPIIGDSLPVMREKTIDIERFAGKEQVHAVLGFRSVPVHHPDGFALDILAEVLGGGRASLLAKELRYARGLVHGVGAWQRGFADAGMWAVQTSASKEKLQEVLDGITSILARVIEHGLTEAEVQFAKEKIEKSKRMQLQTSASWVGFHAYRQLLSPKPWTLIDYLQGISSVTPEDTKKVARKYLGSERWYLALCGDVSDNAVKVNF